MISVRVPKGYDIPIAGEPSGDLLALEKPGRVALLPERIPFVKPRLKVGAGDHVNVGTPLFEDKRNPDVVFLSPGGGVISGIDFGPRRVIREIVIELDPEETYESFPAFEESRIEALDREALIRAIMAGGLWPLLRQLPFGDYADPEKAPPSIIVALGSREPFQPAPAAYLSGRIDLFTFGIGILKKLSDTVTVSAVSQDRFAAEQLDGWLTHTCAGRYPANDPGVLLYHTKKTPDENRAWFIDGQDVLLLAALFKTGKFPVERTVAVGGSLADRKTHAITRAGAPLSHIARERTDSADSARYVVGGLFKGYTGTKDSFLGFYETSLTLVSEGDEREFFGFARPGFHKPSRSRAFFSLFNKSELAFDCGSHGEERACVNCGFCTDVCPVDILPQFAYKCLLADEIEEALSHGMLDCVECGLCTYVCPSKIELAETLKQTKKAYYLEQI